MCFNDIRFARMEHNVAWDRLDSAGELILNFSAIQSALESIVADLGNRLDVTDHHLDTDHGMLSTFTLLYVLYLLRVKVIYQMKIIPASGLDLVLRSLTQTLTEIKGVCLHGER